MTGGPLLHRRALLRGLGGLAIALPLLEAMRPKGAAAAADPVPLRYLLAFGGFSLATDNTNEPSLVLPYGEGRGYVLHETAAGLADLRDDLLWLTGVSIPRAAAGQPIPAGGRHHDQAAFHQHQNPFFAGMRMVGDGRDATVTGPSTDQVVADAVGELTRVRSLHLRAQVLDYAPAQEPNAGQMSYRRMGDDVAPVLPYTSPRQVFDLLTQGIEAADPKERARLQAELARRKSVLDYVDRRLGGLAEKISAADQARLEQHWDDIRDLERRLDLPTIPEQGTCRVPTGWYEDPPVDPSGSSDENERIRRMHELLRFAFSCDLTRTATMMYSQFLASMSGTVAGVSARPMHDIIHFGPLEEVRQICSWHLNHFGDLVRILRDAPEGEGSLLDACAIGYMIEGGYGMMDTINWTSTHSTSEMIILVAGRAGGIQPGRAVRLQQAHNHPVQVQLGLMKAVGVEVAQHGEVAGPVDELFEA